MQLLFYAIHKRQNKPVPAGFSYTGFDFILQNSMKPLSAAYCLLIGNSYSG